MRSLILLGVLAVAACSPAQTTASCTTEAALAPALQGLAVARDPSTVATAEAAKALAQAACANLPAAK